MDRSSLDIIIPAYSSEDSGSPVTCTMTFTVTQIDGTPLPSMISFDPDPIVISGSTASIYTFNDADAGIFDVKITASLDNGQTDDTV